MLARSFKSRPEKSLDSEPPSLPQESFPEVDHRARIQSKSLLYNALVLLLGLLVSFAIAEGFLRIFPNVGLTSSERREVVWRRNHKTAQDLLTRASHSYDQYSPDLGWELKPDLRTPQLNSNSHGMRGTREYTLTPPAGVRRILCVGDSFMLGENLSDAETLPAQLESILNARGQWEVLNLGEHGYGTDQQWLRLHKLGYRYKPDGVVLGFFEDDLGRNTMSFRDYAKPYFERSGERLILRNAPVPSPEELLSHDHLYTSCAFRSWCALTWLAGRLARVSPWVPLKYTAPGTLTLRILDGMLQESRSHGVEFLLMIIPSQHFKSKPTRVESLLIAWAEQTRTPVLNLREAFIQMPKSDQARLYNGHWTAYGAGISAQLLAAKLARLVPM